MRFAMSSTFEREWIIARPHADRDRLARDAGVAPLLAQVLLSRGVADASDAHAFLNPDFKSLLPPEDLPGAAEAGDRLAAAAKAGRRVTIYGDYDVDGITGTAILWHALRQAGADVNFYIPSRFDEGYGVNVDAVEQIASDGGDVLVTVDCGITAVESIARAKALGLEVIITDHHQPKDQLPPADTIVHPTAVGDSPNPHLSGSAVAMKVAWALARAMCGGGKVSATWRELLLETIGLAALGLIADVMPLTGENRIITTYGLKQLKHTKIPGLHALIEVAGLTGKSNYDDFDVGFMLAPRLNAVGRMGHARLAVELFTRADHVKAQQIAETLDGHNRQRQSVERAIVKQAEEQVVELGLDRDSQRGIVLASRDWHPGVIGIVASRLVQRFHRPTVLISLADDIGQGSGRSVPHFPLHEVLADCGEHLVSFGGHAMAAGVKVAADRVDQFRDAFLKQAAQRLTAKDLVPKLMLDDEIALRDLTLPVAETLHRLAPFGEGNPRVRLATDEVELAGPPRAVGKTGSHLQFAVRQNGEQRKAIAFGRGQDADLLNEHRRLRLAFEPIINDFNGRRSVELRVLDWKLSSS